MIARVPILSFTGVLICFIFFSQASQSESLNVFKSNFIVSVHIKDSVIYLQIFGIELNFLNSNIPVAIDENQPHQFCFTNYIIQDSTYSTLSIECKGLQQLYGLFPNHKASIKYLMNEIPHNVKVGKGCVINSGSQIIAETGEIVIGDYTIIEEGVIIRNNQLKRMIIGSYNIIEISCVIENSNIGDCNFFEAKTVIESGCTIKNNCRFGCASKVPQKQTFEDFSRVYYPYNVLRIQNQDMANYKEETMELCMALIQIHENAKKAKLSQHQ